MSSSSAQPGTPRLVPQPRELQLLDGTTEFSSDVRLATSNVLPFMRKTMRGIFSSANVRIVANKKKFVIHVNIVSEAEMHLDGIPAEAIRDCYEMDVVNNVVVIKAVSQIGAIWGTQTFADLFRLAGCGGIMPNLKIRDWGGMRTRGIHLRSDKTFAAMHMDEWCSVADRFAELKLNVFNLELLTQVASQPDGEMCDLLLIPYPQQEEMKTPVPRSWYSPEYKTWKQENAPPPLAQEDPFGQFVNYVSERGMILVPAFSAYRPNRIFTANFPDLAGQAPAGAPESVCCISGENAREALEKIYTSLLERYFPDGLQYLALQTDLLPVNLPPDQRCQCPDCSSKNPSDTSTDFLLWLCEMLTAKGVQAVVLQHPAEHSGEDAFLIAVRDALASKGLSERVVWMFTSGREELPAWTAKATPGPATWLLNGSATVTPDAVHELFSKPAVSGFLTAVNADPVWVEAERILATSAWNPAEDRDGAQIIADYTALYYSEQSGTFAKAYAQLLEARRRLPDALVQTEAGDTASADILDAAAACGMNAETLSQCRDAVTAAQQAAALFKELMQIYDAAEHKPYDPVVLRSAYGEAEKIAGIAAVVATLSPVAADLKKGNVTDAVKAAAQEALSTLKAAMAVVEKSKPRYIAPAVLEGMSGLYKALETLAG